MPQTSNEREADIVETMTRLADTLVSGFDPIELLRDLTVSCARVLDADAAGVSLRDNGSLQFVAATTEEPALIELIELDHDGGPCRDAYRSARHVAAVDITSTGTQWPAWGRRALELGFHAADAFPLRLRDETIGALSVYARRSRELGGRDAVVGRAFADIATIGLLQYQAIADQRVVQTQLQHALRSRIAIEQAKGVLAERNGIDLDKAFEVIRRHARSTHAKVADVADEIVAGRLHLPVC